MIYVFYFILQNVIKKRSLLTRGEKSLERIASLAKQGDSASHAVNTRNFVFPHIDQNTDTTSKKEKEIIEDLDSKIKVYINLITLFKSNIKCIIAIRMFFISFNFYEIFYSTSIERSLYILTNISFL